MVSNDLYQSFKMLLRKNRLQTVYTDSLEELERDGQLLVNIPAGIVDEVQSMKMWLVCAMAVFAMSRKSPSTSGLLFSLIDMFGPSIQEVADFTDITKAAKDSLYRARMNLDSFFKTTAIF